MQSSLTRNVFTLGMLSLCLAGCPSDGSGMGGDKAVVTGTLHQMPVTMHDAVSAAATIKKPDGTQSPGAVIVMSSTTGLCADFASTPGVEHPGEELIVLEVPAAGGAAAVAEGHYAVGVASGQAVAGSVTLDGNCTAIKSDNTLGTSGSIAIEAVDGDSYGGTFDVAFAGGDHVAGSFLPDACPALRSALGSMMANATCK